MLRTLLLATFLLLPFSSNAAITQVPGGVYTGINFSVGLNVGVWYPSSCNTLLLDLNGSITGSGRFSTYGVLNCPASNTSYGVLAGMGYLTTAGTVAMYLNVAGDTWNCVLNVNTLGGSCTVTTGSVSRGNVILTFTP